ncbi:MMPL family transporter [Trichloromonas sp.]|uniref:MMPL family transporter n=1 Tax=Trichloromonas sp. TaxID=3069249 RepID=UPI003D813D6F
MFFSALYRLFAPRRALLYTLTLLLLGAGLAGLTRLEVREDIEAMLPDDTSQVADDFRRLQQAPFARKVLISLRGGQATGTLTLLEAADGLATALSPEFFGRAVTGPAMLDDSRLPEWLESSLPLLLGGDDLQRIADGLTRERVQEQLEEDYRRMLSPEGWLLKGTIRRDPLELRNLGLERLRFVNPISKTRLQAGHFLSADGRSALIIADTSVAITDSGGGARMLEQFRQAADGTLPQGVEAKLISGHAYTVANAEAIQRDLFVVLTASTLGLALLFLVFLRSWRALFVFLVPVSVVGLAAVAVSWCYPAVSGVTLGFGAVLLGIAVDFGLHVYFALRQSGGEPEAALGRVSRPVLFGALTTLAGFAVLLSSSLPGQRQLAVFAMTGIAAALLLSLIVLPHLVANRWSSSPRRLYQSLTAAPRRKPGLLLVFWLAAMIACSWKIAEVPINGELRSLSLIPAELLAAEQELQQTWGNLRSMAMVFAEGGNLQEALAANDMLFELLRRELPEAPVVSLAALLPSTSTQAANLERWQTFWQQRDESTRRLLLQAGESRGFSAAAFDPFFAELQRQPEPVTAAALRQLGLGDLLDALLLENGDGVQLVTLVPDTPEVAALLNGEAALPPGIHLVSQARFGREVGNAIRADFLRFITLAGGAVVIMVSLLLRRPGRILLALLPVATGLVVMLGTMGWLGMEFNLFNIVATILVIGLGVDYGIFMVCRGEPGEDGATRWAVLVAGLTTLAGFGALVFAEHPALHSIGTTVLLGIGGAVPTALLVVPALQRERL